MFSSLDGVCTDVIFDPDAKMVRFTIQDSLGKYSICDYYFDDKLPLKRGDMVFCTGEFTAKIIGGEWYNIFVCNDLTARYEFDLLNFLIQYMPYMKIDNKHDVSTVTQYYRDVTDRIIDYCIMSMGEYSIDNICKLFNGLYRCIEIDDDEELLKFSSHCFKNSSIRKIKHFFIIWNNDVLVRPLELLGLTTDEIKSIHIPLYDAYKIIKNNPYRLPQIPIEKASKIAMSHLRLEQQPLDYVTNHEKLEYNSIKAILCGNISRMVYENVAKRKWTSTPINRILERFPDYEEFKPFLEKYYYCIEEFDHVYFTKIYNIEKCVSNKISFLMKKTKREIKDPIYSGLIPSKKQGEAIKGSLENHISLIHGGPGTGKTAILSEIIRNASANGDKVLCTALTGAATTRIRETTMESGVFDLTTIMTMNMAITMVSKILDSNFKYVVVDEVSMINTGLISEFISVFRTLDYQFIFIGDSNQLEPIEWGNFMKQLLKTPIVKFHLTENFRSEKTIVKICEDVINHERIHSQRAPEWNKIGPDYKFTIGGLDILEQWIRYYAHNFQIDNSISMEANLQLFSKYTDKFTIISPYRKVVDQINPIFQKYFMSHIKEYTEIGGNRFYLGDRVMKLVNDYGINVMNGEIGKVIKVTPNYIVCMFRNKKETITPYVEKTKFLKMKNFVKKNKITFNPYIVAKDGTRIEKKKEEIKSEVDILRIQFQIDMSENKSNSESDTINTDVYETIEEKNKKEENEIIKLYFSLLEEYPLALYNIGEEAEFLNINTVTLSYTISCHKSQGSQYDYTIYFLNGKMNCFVTVNNVYTGISRAKKHLHIITESVELINNACLNKQRFVYDKLYERINSKLPKEMVDSMIVEEVVIEDNDDSPEENDEVELDEDYDLGY